MASQGTTMTGVGTTAAPVTSRVEYGRTSQASSASEERAADEPDGQQEDLLEGQPRSELPTRQPECAEQGELAESLARRDRRPDDEADGGEHDRGEGAEGKGADDPEPDRVRGEGVRELGPEDDLRRRIRPAGQGRGDRLGLAVVRREQPLGRRRGIAVRGEAHEVERGPVGDEERLVRVERREGRPRWRRSGPSGPDRPTRPGSCRRHGRRSTPAAARRR